MPTVPFPTLLKRAILSLRRQAGERRTHREGGSECLTQRGPVHVFRQAFASNMRFLAEEWTSPRTLRFSAGAEIISLEVLFPQWYICSRLVYLVVLH
jgi:hypothetical protein